MSMLAPWFLAGLAALGVPVAVHLINRERKTVVEFPSLMFLLKISYKSVRRQKLRHLLLFALRCLALVLLVAAFGRPFFGGRAHAGALAGGARERIILLDRSYSMGYGVRWQAATAAARNAVADIGRNDRATLVLFDEEAEVASEPTASHDKLERAIAAARPGDEATKYGPALALAARMLEGSNLPRREVVIISDFQQSGWARRDEVRLPAGTALIPADVGRDDAPDVAVAGVTADRARDGDRYHVAVAARLANTGTEAKTVEATLAVGGRDVDSRRVSVPARGAAQVRFATTKVPVEPTRVTVRITPDALKADDTFHFTIAPDEGVSVLIVQPAAPRVHQSLFLQRALSIGDRPPFRVEVRRADSLSAVDFGGRSLVVLNEVPPPAGLTGARLREAVTKGAGLLLVPGDVRTDARNAEWRAALPAQTGATVDRTRDAGGSIASVDYGHPVFEQFAREGDFSTAHLFRYRALVPAVGAAVLARFDDGSPALVERALGQGQVMVFASSLDDYWTDLPTQSVYLPFVHELARYAARHSDARPWFPVGQSLDLSRHGELTAAFTRGDTAAELVLQSPSGRRTLHTATGPRHVAMLGEAGFYELRDATTPMGSGRPIAVNVDLAEADLSRFDPRELVAAVTAPAPPEAGVTGKSGAATAYPAPAAGDNAQSSERRQGIWWFLLLAALFCAGAETVLSNRLSPRVPA